MTSTTTILPLSALKRERKFLFFFIFTATIQKTYNVDKQVADSAGSATVNWSTCDLYLLSQVNYLFNTQRRPI